MKTEVVTYTDSHDEYLNPIGTVYKLNFPTLPGEENVKEFVSVGSYRVLEARLARMNESPGVDCMIDPDQPSANRGRT